jgi:hypothetical protein
MLPVDIRAKGMAGHATGPLYEKVQKQFEKNFGQI